MIPGILSQKRHGTAIEVVIDCAYGQMIKLMHMSDAHFDSIYCDRDLLKAHLEKAKQEGAFILIYGDWFDAMQGKFDPRRNMDELRPEYRQSNYYDLVVDNSAEFLKPYSETILMISPGNHEAAVLSNANTNLTDRLCAALRVEGSPVMHGFYNGWVKIVFKTQMKGHQLPLKIKYNHGYGATEAPVTKGVIQTNRQAVYLPDADLVVNGHNHQNYVLAQPRERLKYACPYQDILWFIRTPGYKAEYINAGDSHAAMRRPGPTPRGCVFSEHEYIHDSKGVDRLLTKVYSLIV